MVSRRAFLCGASVSVVMALSTTAQAQTAAENSANSGQPRLQEIIVTAQKRAENVQDVPIAISAISPDQIAAGGSQSITQISQVAPNVQIEATSGIIGSSQTLIAFIRGIGQNDFSSSFDQGVGLYIDGVYISRNIGAVTNLLDFERLEVLKGPQGTLFGRNTIGGAINVVTREPADEFRYQADITTGSFDRFDIRGVVDIPLVADNLYSQVAFSSINRDGYQKRIPFPGANNFVSETGLFPNSGDVQRTNDRQGGQDSYSGRAKLRFDNGGRFKVSIIGDYTKTDEDSAPTTLLQTNDLAGGAPTFLATYNACISLDTATLSAIGLGALCGPRAVVNTPLGGANVDADPFNDRLLASEQFITDDIDTTYATGVNYARVKAWGLAGTAEYELSDAFTLKSITAFRDLDAAIGQDVDGMPLEISDISTAIRDEQFSQELQLNYSLFDNRAKGTMGVYYFDESNTNEEKAIFGQGLGQYGNSRPGFNFATTTKSYAAFFHMNADLTDRLGLTAGIRYTKDKKTLIGTQSDDNQFLLKAGVTTPDQYPDPTNLNLLYPIGTFRASFDNVSVRLGLDYDITDDIMVYGSFANGFKSGGFTTRLSAPAPGNIPGRFAPEKAETYEIGFKSQLFDNRVKANFAAFRTDYSNMQVTIIRGVSPLFENAGAGRIEGFELETQALLSNNLTVGANVGYLDARYTELEPGVTVTLDSDFPNAPEWSLATYADLEVPAFSGMLNFHTDFSYKSSMARNIENTALLYSGKSELLNASITYEAPDGNWSITGGVSNILDDRTIAAGTDIAATGVVSASYSRPREWFLTLRLNGF